jgi:hypothetical protein
MNQESKRPAEAEDLSETGYATRELAMAAYLSLNGYLFDLNREGESRAGHPVGSWRFRDRDGELGTHVQKFNSGEAEVEPDRFLKEVNNVRKALFRFLGIGKSH